VLANAEGERGSSEKPCILREKKKTSWPAREGKRKEGEVTPGWARRKPPFRKGVKKKPAPAASGKREKSQLLLNLNGKERSSVEFGGEGEKGGSISQRGERTSGPAAGEERNNNGGLLKDRE